MCFDRNLKKGFLIFLFVLFAFLLVHYAGREAKALLSAEEISQEEAEKLKQGKTEVTAKELGGLQLYGCALPYSVSDDIWYVPQQVQTDSWKGNLQAAREDLFLYLVEDVYYQKKEEAIRENHTFRFLLCNKKCYAEGTLVFTGLPAVVLRPESVDEQGISSGTAAVFENGKGSSPYDAREFKASYYVRGGTSRNLPKKGYRMVLKKKNKKKDSLSLLGMRTDDDWILCPMYADPNRVRDKLCTDLWNLLRSEDSPSGTRMEYVELFIGDSYEGIYGLMEPVDYQQLDLEKGSDLLYKFRNWDIPTAEDFAAAAASSVCLGIEVKTDAMPDYSALWEPCALYMDLMFGEDGEKLPEAVETGQCSLDNILDIGLFVEAICGSDNKFKNQYLAAIQDGDGWIFRRTLWDMDLSFGLYYDSNFETNTAFDPGRTGKKVLDPVYEQLLKTGKYREKIAEKWRTFRENGLNEGTIGRMVDETAELLSETGAFDRETKRWPGSGASLDMEGLKTFAAGRLAFLDETYLSEEWNAGLSE